MASAFEESNVPENPKGGHWTLTWENYTQQRQQWPERGKHILAHYDKESVIVYQAFKPSIAKYAVEHQRFGGPDFSFERMSWVKTNFMWMMYRCGWATKKNQERVLAVRIRKEGFEEILFEAYTAWKQKEMGVQTQNIQVRLQWDPDHDPKGWKLERRAIQLGLKGQMLHDYVHKHLLNIIDITEEVRTQAKLMEEKGIGAILSPTERVYVPIRHETTMFIGLDLEPTQTVVGFTS